MARNRNPGGLPDPGSDPGHQRALDLAAAESWMLAEGLPWFVDTRRRRVGAALRSWRLIIVLGVLLIVCPGLGYLVTQGFGTGADGVVLAIQTFCLGLLAYALMALEVWPILKWAVKRTLASLGLLVPLVTRAVPLLLLFVTFLFINAEVWQVAAGMNGRKMWLVILLFLVVAVAFLLVRLPEEMAVFDRDIAVELVQEGAQDTPMAQASARYGELSHETRDEIDDVEGLQRINLVVMLVLAQLVQVLLLFATMLVFFVLFGLLIMSPQAVLAWTQQNALHPIFGMESLNRELLRVAVFLSAFSGLYFAVYTVTDEMYRQSFFTSMVKDMQRALAVRAVYRMLRDVEGPTTRGKGTR